jgi:protein-tyrosine-phosphatase
VFRRHVADPRIAVGSYGTLDQRGAPALVAAVRAARRYGVDLRDHRATYLSEGILTTSDLVVGFEPIHVATAVVEGGAPRARAFLLSELAGALDVVPAHAPDAHWADLLEQADLVRRASDHQPRAIADPVRMSDEGLHEVYSEVEALVCSVAGRLFGA